ncbi:ATP-binding protein [Persicobacter diffluens]|uniref:ATPase AAA n=1 Tax=Persicobacter diffluens TaxID=981 RepID=A0AAN5ALL3_9BACT|nr:ATPase AAA [Persicobacter diffluens]
MSTDRKALPIGIQTFEDLRASKDDFLYIDKTKEIFQLTRLNKGYYFLSRPRRFGKSMLCSTLQSLFDGKKALFEGLNIHDHWDWTQTYPVIRMDMSAANYTDIGVVHEKLNTALKENAQNLGVDIALDAVPGTAFRSLITEVSKKYQKQVVIIIDEYDKAIQDTLNKEGDLAAEAMDALRGFYSAIKASDAHVRFCFMTGITKFTGMGLFSGANNFNDISLDSKFASICGFTQNELENCFGSYFDHVDMDNVKRWYNGYNYLGDKVYNPFDILLFLDKGNSFQNYWWQTGTPTFLAKLFEKGEYQAYQLGSMELPAEELHHFTLKNLNLVSLLWQTGYLTIESVIEEPFGGSSYVLTTPNHEVQRALNALFLTSLTDLRQNAHHQQQHALRSIFKNDLAGFEKAIRAMFSAIPYNNYVQSNIQKFEGYYASVIYAYLLALGLKTRTEQATSAGRIDLVMESPSHIYIVEFKVNAPDPVAGQQGEAIQQIIAQQYYAPYLNDGRPIVLIGMHFSEEEKNLSLFEVVEWKA